jgi:hypothetical protein
VKPDAALHSVQTLSQFCPQQVPALQMLDMHSLPTPQGCPLFFLHALPTHVAAAPQVLGQVTAVPQLLVAGPQGLPTHAWPLSVQVHTFAWHVAGGVQVAGPQGML